MLTFKKKYFILALLIFCTEVLIALYVHDSFVRPYFGDVLVVVLMYYSVRAFFNFRILNVALSVLSFSYIIEFLQDLEIVEALGLAENRILATAIGADFSWWDMLCYTAGALWVVAAEYYFNRNKWKTQST